MYVVNHLRTHGEDIIDQKFVEKVLKSLLVKFDVVVVAIEKSKNLAHLSIDELMGSLLSHETRMNMDGDSLENVSKSQVYINIGRGRNNRGRGRYNRVNSQRDGNSSSYQGGTPQWNSHILRGSGRDHQQTKTI